MLKGIDISHYQKSTVITPVYDFVICKASEGVTIKDKSFLAHIKKCKENKIDLVGAYHFAKTNTDVKKNAENFINAISDCEQLGKSMLLVLDLEADDMKRPNAIKWALEWLQLVETATGVKPLIYCSASDCGKLKPLLQNNNGLWVAHWNVKKPKTGVYPLWALWQYKVDTIDHDYFNGSRTQYLKYCEKH